MIPAFTYCLCLFALQVLIWRLTRSRLYRVALTVIAVLVATVLAGVAIFVTMWLMGADLSKPIVLRPAGPWLMFGLISATVAAVGRAAKRGADGPVDRAAKALKLGRTGTRASNELTSILPQLAGIRERLVYLKRQTPSDDEASTTIREQAIAELSNEANSLVERLASLLQPCGIDALAALDQLADAFTNERYQGASSATEISTSARIAVVKEYFLQRGPACQRAQSEVLSEAGALLELRLDMEQLRASCATSDSRGKASFVLSSRIAVELAKRPDSHKDLHHACKQKLSRQQGALVSSIAKYRTSASPALIQDLTESLERMRLPPSTTPCDAANHCLAQLKLEVSGRLLGRHSPNPSESDARHYRIGWIILTVIGASVALIIFLIAQNSTSEEPRVSAAYPPQKTGQGDRLAPSPPVSPLSIDNGSVVLPSPEQTASSFADDQTNIDAEPATSTTQVDPKLWKNGRLVAAQGVQLKPRKPQFTMLQQVSSLPNCRPPVVSLTFDGTGKCVGVFFNRSSGDSEIDGVLKSSLFFWRAAGKKIDDLKGTETVRITLQLLL